MDQQLMKDDERMFTLVRTADGLVLSVVCGGIGMYEVAIRLTPEEETRFREEGPRFIEDLAYRVARHEGEFADRRVKG